MRVGINCHLEVTTVHVLEISSVVKCSFANSNITLTNLIKSSGCPRLHIWMRPSEIATLIRTDLVFEG